MLHTSNISHSAEDHDLNHDLDRDLGHDLYRDLGHHLDRVLGLDVELDIDLFHDINNLY